MRHKDCRYKHSIDLFTSTSQKIRDTRSIKHPLQQWMATKFHDKVTN